MSKEISTIPDKVIEILSRPFVTSDVKIHLVRLPRELEAERAAKLKAPEQGEPVRLRLVGGSGDDVPV